MPLLDDLPDCTHQRHLKKQAIEIEKMQKRNQELKATLAKAEEEVHKLEDKLNMVKMVCDQDMKVKDGRNIWY